MLDSILDLLGHPFRPPNRSEMGPKIIQKSRCANIPPGDRPKRPQDCPKRPQDPPKRLQIHPKKPPRPPKDPLGGLQKGPKIPLHLSKWPQECSKMICRDKTLSDMIFFILQVY